MQADLFYASTDNTQESSSVILLDDQMDTHFQTGKLFSLYAYSYNVSFLNELQVL